MSSDEIMKQASTTEDYSLPKLGERDIPSWDFDTEIEEVPVVNAAA